MFVNVEQKTLKFVSRVWCHILCNFNSQSTRSGCRFCLPLK